MPSIMLFKIIGTCIVAQFLNTIEKFLKICILKYLLCNIFTKIRKKYYLY